MSESIATSNADWAAWATGDEPHTQPLPAGWEEKVGHNFGKLLIIKVLREEKLIFACGQVGAWDV